MRIRLTNVWFVWMMIEIARSRRHRSKWNMYALILSIHRTNEKKNGSFRFVHLCGQCFEQVIGCAISKYCCCLLNKLRIPRNRIFAHLLCLYDTNRMLCVLSSLFLPLFLSLFLSLSHSPDASHFIPFILIWCKNVKTKNERLQRRWALGKSGLTQYTQFNELSPFEWFYGRPLCYAAHSPYCSYIPCIRGLNKRPKKQTKPKTITWNEITRKIN